VTQFSLWIKIKLREIIKLAIGMAEDRRDERGNIAHDARLIQFTLSPLSLSLEWHSMIKRKAERE
jgi:hypothetical protein